MAFTKKIAAVSIVTRSYIPFARVLFGSIRKFYPDMPLYLLLVDKLEGDCSCGEGVEVIPVSEINLPELGNMLQRYSNTEICVALKPFAIKEIFRRTQDRIEGVIYMDSDIYVVSAMEELEKHIDSGEQIILTPHLNTPSVKGNTSDLVMLKCGVFNMGFAYFANTSSARFILNWWGDWLKHFCYEDFTSGLFGDQKWMDLLPCYTDDFMVLRHDGYNVAYWNIDQRPVTLQSGQWKAGEAPLRFLHLSCPQLEPEPLFSKNTDRYDAASLYDLPVLVREYAERVINAGFHNYMSKPCLLRVNKLTRADPRRQNSFASLRLSKKSKIACGILLSPLAFLMQARKLLSLGRLKSLGKMFLGPVLTSPDFSYQWLQKQNKIIRFLTETPFLLSVHLRQTSGDIPSLVRVIKGQGLAAVKKEAEGTLNVDKLPSPNSILVTDARVPHHDMIAADLTTFNLLKDLVRFGYTVTFVPWGAPWPERYAMDLRRLGVILDYSPEQHGSTVDYVKTFGHRYAAFYLQPMGLAAELVPVIRDVAPKAKIVFHAADLCFVREQREADLKQDAALRKSAAQTKKQELDLIRRVDHLVVISDKEKEFITAEVGRATPVSSFTCLYSKCLDAPMPFENRNGVLFIGVFGHRPNVDAVLWFVREVWPLVREKNPDMVFHVVGNYAPPEIQELDGKDGIIIEGFVKDLDPLLASVRLAVAPLRYGAGIKGKIGTTMGSGVPNVCTSIATEGMGIENEKQALVADSPESFAAAVLRLHSDAALWQKLSLAGLAMVKAQYSEDAGTRQFEQVLREAGVWLNQGKQ